jgi:hypothetical protein
MGMGANLVVYWWDDFETLETAAAMVQIVFGSASILSLRPKSTGQPYKERLAWHSLNP